MKNDGEIASTGKINNVISQEDIEERGADGTGKSQGEKKRRKTTTLPEIGKIRGERST